MTASETVLEAVIPQSSSKPPENLRETIDQLRLDLLLLPRVVLTKHDNRKDYPLRGGSLEFWREGYRSGIQHALKMLESIQ